MTRRSYATPAAFKRALEDHLRATSETGVDFTRRRQLLAFDRFLARTAVAFGDAVIGPLAAKPTGADGSPLLVHPR